MLRLRNFAKNGGVTWNKYGMRSQAGAWERDKSIPMARQNYTSRNPPLNGTELLQTLT